MTFLNEAHRELPQGVFDQDVWTYIANGIYKSGTTPVSLIQCLIDRFIHQLITFTIDQEKIGDMFCKLDLFFLSCILTLGVVCNIPYHVAQLLSEKAAEGQAGAPIYGGHLVTHLARSNIHLL